MNFFGMTRYFCLCSKYSNYYSACQVVVSLQAKKGNRAHRDAHYWSCLTKYGFCKMNFMRFAWLQGTLKMSSGFRIPGGISGPSPPFFLDPGITDKSGSGPSVSGGEDRHGHSPTLPYGFRLPGHPVLLVCFTFLPRKEEGSRRS